MPKYNFDSAFKSARMLLRSATQQGVRVVNISSSDPSQNFEKVMSKIIKVPETADFCKYYFTQSFRPQLLDELKVQLGTKGPADLVLLPTATHALYNALYLLKMMGGRKVAIVSPYYFSVYKDCCALGLAYDVLPLKTTENTIRLPVEEIASKHYDAVLVTSPIYGTGIYFNEHEIKCDVHRIRKSGCVMIFDEVLTLPGKELVRWLPIDNKMLYVYSPHKAIGLNAFKFAVIVTSHGNGLQLRQCAEAFAGALNRTSVQAVIHFTKRDNFDDCVKTYVRYVDGNRNILAKSTGESFANTHGHYVSLVPNTKCLSNKNMLGIMKRLITDVQMMFYPPWPSWGDGVRINLTLDKSTIKKVKTVFAYLHDEGC